MNSSYSHSRRHFLAGSALSLSTVALDWMLRQEQAAAAPVTARPETEPVAYDLKAKAPPQPAKAKAMISLWMQGGPSHHDLFDPKPLLDKLDGTAFPGEIKYDDVANASSKILASPWKFAPRGKCGMEISDLLPYTSQVVDDICLIRSMHTGVNNHGQSIQALQSGRVAAGRPSLGSWLAYGLGCEADNLPAFLALTDPGPLPVLGVDNWQCGFLPSLYQGTVIRPQEPRILDLTPSPLLAGAPQEKSLGFLEELNRRHVQARPRQFDLEARIASYELAAKMQIAATEALDLSQETKSTQEMYGMHSDNAATKEYGARCLLARRLIERGVRFIQIYTPDQMWDSHGSLITRLPAACMKVDQPSAALVQDLKARGLLDTTVVHWGGEMGRLPVIENDNGRDKVGRDHNTYGFSMWVAGGGFKAGHVHGATDEFGHHAVENVVNHFDYHATLLHLFGLDPDKLTYNYARRDQTLTDGQAGKIVKEILA